ncbi:ABC-2 type transport system permease protein [Kribbella sp. VKM Ac-2569]|uniref:ABC transporter permease n=1 Tax=Kribbella sp. VKM Ac-2569 TaxID=2512220 RepID=UPI00102BE4E7|nr:ABC-2 family transporter protein [Kribbella sp. VKM Ac-2569]RZT26701.1 ABC-2 type transport system permease protein [Kribbella sp. VKM Ac-2569]
MRAALRGTAAMVRLGAQSALHFRVNVGISVVGACLQAVLLIVVWRNVYANRQTVQGVGVDIAVQYAILSLAVAHLALPFRLSSLPERVRQGAIATDVIRPIGVTSQNLAHSVGEAAAALPGSVAVLIVGCALDGISAPRDLWAAGFFVLSVGLGLLMAWTMNLTVSMVAFWTTDTRGTFYIYRTLATFCSGAIVPLWFIPEWLAHMLNALPFRLQIFAPLEIWFGQVTYDHSKQLLIQQASWLAVLFLLLHLVARRALRVVVVNGG